ncbi:MAG: hypothetical protein QXR28_05475 [Nitrososphaerota archaeon]
MFATSEEEAMRVYSMLKERMHGRILSMPVPEYTPQNGSLTSYTMIVKADYGALWRAVRDINGEFWRDDFRARIYSWGRFVDVYKGVGYPLDVYNIYHMGGRELYGDMWIAHTRQPTNSPGRLPIWSHPFASGEWAIVHNGDISSFGSNMELLWSLGYTAPECAALLTIERTTINSHASRARALVVPPGMTPRHAVVQAWAGLHRACCLAHVWGQLDHIGA